MTQLIDAHCHLNDPGCDDGIVNAVGIHEWDDIVARGGAAAIGVHPWNVSGVGDDWAVRLERILASRPDLMVGEIGLDRCRGDFVRQVDIFTRQLEIAARLRRAVHVHCVRAWDVMLAVLARTRPLPPVIVMHGYRANDDITRACMRYDSIYYSFSRPAVAAAMVPENRILVETDGKPDIDLSALVRRIAAMRSVEADTLAAIIYNNTRRVTGHGQIKPD